MYQPDSVNDVRSWARVASTGSRRHARRTVEVVRTATRTIDESFGSPLPDDRRPDRLRHQMQVGGSLSCSRSLTCSLTHSPILVLHQVQQLEVQRTQLDYHEAVHYATTAARRHTEALEARITRLHDDVSLARTATKRHAVALERVMPRNLKSTTIQARLPAIRQWHAGVKVLVQDKDGRRPAASTSPVDTVQGRFPFAQRFNFDEVPLAFIPGQDYTYEDQGSATVHIRQPGSGALTKRMGTLVVLVCGDGTMLHPCLSSAAKATSRPKSALPTTKTCLSCSSRRLGWTTPPRWPTRAKCWTPSWLRAASSLV